MSESKMYTLSEDVIVDGVLKTIYTSGIYVPDPRRDMRWPEMGLNDDESFRCVKNDESNRCLSDNEMLGIECTAQWRDMLNKDI